MLIQRPLLGVSIKWLVLTPGLPLEFRQTAKTPLGWRQGGDGQAGLLPGGLDLDPGQEAGLGNLLRDAERRCRRSLAAKVSAPLLNPLSYLLVSTVTLLLTSPRRGCQLSFLFPHLGHQGEAGQREGSIAQMVGGSFHWGDSVSDY